jgi:hypothetical protein
MQEAQSLISPALSKKKKGTKERRKTKDGREEREERKKIRELQQTDKKNPPLENLPAK